MKISHTLLILSFIASTSAFAGDVFVHGYTRRDGSYVPAHHRTTPDNTINNNYGTEGNLNPYTGESGHIPRNPYQPQGNYNNGNGMGYYNYGNDN